MTGVKGMKIEKRRCEGYCGQLKTLRAFTYITKGGEVKLRTDMCNRCKSRSANNIKGTNGFAPDDHFDPFSQEWLGKPLIIDTCCNVLVPLRTSKVDGSDKIGSKMCPDCKTKYPWGLDKGQKPLITPSQDRGL